MTHENESSFTFWLHFGHVILLIMIPFSKNRRTAYDHCHFILDKDKNNSYKRKPKPKLKLKSKTLLSYLTMTVDFRDFMIITCFYTKFFTRNLFNIPLATMHYILVDTKFKGIYEYEMNYKHCNPTFKVHISSFMPPGLLSYTTSQN